MAEIIRIAESASEAVPAALPQNIEAEAALLGALREEGCAVVFTTHRPGLLGAADRVLALRNGTLAPAAVANDASARRTPGLASPVARISA